MSQPLPALFARLELELTQARRHISAVTPESLFRSLPGERGERYRTGRVVCVRFRGAAKPKQRALFA